jgi:exopolysaccharide biosynthesis operon protein EpsL
MNRTAATLSLACTAALALPGPAYADAEDTLNFLVGASLYRDDNVFHLAPGLDPHSVGLTAGRSDTVRSGQLGLRIDKAWSLQRVQLDAATSNNRYSNYSYLSYNANTYRGAWLWQLTPRLTGTLSADRQQSLVNYADYRNFTERNVRTLENRHFDADWWLHGSWHLVGGLTQNDLRNGSSFVQEENYRLRFAEAGAKYVAESGSWVSLVGRDGHGSYPNIMPSAASQVDNDFRQRELELRANWQVSARSTLDGRIAHLARRHANFQARDYGGTIARLNYLWSPTAQVQIGLTAAREIGSYQDFRLPYYTSSYQVTDSLSLAPIWNFSAKAALRLKYDSSRRRYKGEIQPGLLQRKDTPHSLLAGLDWMPTRTLTLSCTLQRDHRGSNVPGFDYDDNSIGLNAQLLF